MKCGCLRACQQQKGSLPVRGAWVEILNNARAAYVTTRRSPCGERGLKLTAKTGADGTMASLPVRGAWVEIKEVGFCEAIKPSLPVRGAWVEIRTWRKSSR